MADSDQNDKIAVATLITCHNRKGKTISCLDALAAQDCSPHIDITVYLVDDGSVDGTAQAVQNHPIKHKLFMGDGTLFWGGGMRLAFTEAIHDNPDYFLWLNDDTILYPNALSNLLDASRSLNANAQPLHVVTGSQQDPETGELTHGGVMMKMLPLPPALRLVPPSDHTKPCDTILGNCVLIPRCVTDSVGNLSDVYTHCLGDVDYGLRARAKGIGCWVAPGFHGTCRLNPTAGTWQDSDLTFFERYRNFSQTKMVPWSEWLFFCKTHLPLLLPLSILKWLLLPASPGMLRFLRKMRRLRESTKR
ncbi:MAG: glycosyltransferase family 2 protein [Proteobacteria bacterium]|nr:glycosyltransferase family 2 protein [Pseudomonadota bacterium]